MNFRILLGSPTTKARKTFGNHLRFPGQGLMGEAVNVSPRVERHYLNLTDSGPGTLHQCRSVPTPKARGA